MDKKAFMKTLEALSVAVITIMFVLAIVPKLGVIEENLQRNDILINLELNPGFRQYVLESDGCFNSSDAVTDSYINSFMAPNNDYEICIDGFRYNFPTQSVIAEILKIAGNDTEFNLKTVRLYYWNKNG